MVMIIIWVVLSLICASAGSNKKIGYGGAFLLCLLLSPIIGLIIALISSEKEKEIKKPKQIKIIRCDGCRDIIKGTYIVIRPEGMQEKYDYCGESCRDKFHPAYMKEKGVEWLPPVKNK